MRLTIDKNDDMFDSVTGDRVGYCRYSDGKGWMYDLTGYNESEWYVSKDDAFLAANGLYESTVDLE